MPFVKVIIARRLRGSNAFCFSSHNKRFQHIRKHDIGIASFWLTALRHKLNISVDIAQDVLAPKFMQLLEMDQPISAAKKSRLDKERVRINSYNWRFILTRD